MKPGADVVAYANWSRGLEDEVVTLIPGLDRFHIYAIERADAETGTPHWDVVETALLEDWHVFPAAWETDPRLKEIWQEFLDFIDPDSLTVAFGREV
jgi:hypothetical protein